MGAVRPGEVVKLLPFTKFCFQINVIFISEQLVKLLLIGSMRSFDFPVELWRSGLDIFVFNPQILDVPMEFRLEFMSSIGSDLLYPERKPMDDVIYKVYSIGLCVAFINF